MTDNYTGRPLPGGDYAIVELWDDTTVVGRFSEVEKFGTKMLAIEPLFNDTLLPVCFHGGQAIYRLQPCSVEVARESQPRSVFELPPAILAIVPRELLPSDNREAIAGQLLALAGVAHLATREDLLRLMAELPRMTKVLARVRRGEYAAHREVIDNLRKTIGCRQLPVAGSQGWEHVTWDSWRNVLAERAKTPNQQDTGVQGPAAWPWPTQARMND